MNNKEIEHAFSQIISGLQLLQKQFIETPEQEPENWRDEIIKLIAAKIKANPENTEKLRQIINDMGFAKVSEVPYSKRNELIQKIGEL